MNSQNSMPEKSSNKNPIEKIVVCGCSFSLPGQSGVENVWSDRLEKKLGIKVDNITLNAGAGNSEILRRIVEYCWSKDTVSTGVIVQWSSIDRLEYCDEKDWYSTKRSYEDPATQMKLDKLIEAQAYTYSESTHLWQYIQQVLALDTIMKQKGIPYFQVYCIGSVLNNFFHNMSKLYFTKYGQQIYKTLNKTKWLLDDVMKADLTNKGFPVVSKDDLHFNSEGHDKVAGLMTDHIRMSKWI